MSDAVLEVVQATLVDLGYPETALRLRAEADERRARPAGLLVHFRQWLVAQLRHGPPYAAATAALETLAAGGVAGAVSQDGGAAVAPADAPSPPRARAVLYWVRRVLFLQSVVGQAYDTAGGATGDAAGGATGGATPLGPAGPLVDFLRHKLLPLLDEADFALTRASESAVLLALVADPPAAATLGHRVFVPRVLLASVPRRDDLVVQPTQWSDSQILNDLAVRYVAGGVASPAAPPAAPPLAPHRLRRLLREAAAFDRTHSRFRLTPRAAAPDDFDFSAGGGGAAGDDAARDEASAFPLSPLVTLTPHTDEVWCVQFLPSGSFLLTGSKDGRLVIYDLRAQCDAVATLDGGAPEARDATGSGRGVVCCCWDPHERYVVSCGLDTAVRVWDVRGVTAAAKRAPDDARLVACFSLGQHVRVRLCKFLPEAGAASAGGASAAAGAAAGAACFVVGSPDKALKVFDVRGEEVFDFFAEGDEIDADAAAAAALHTAFTRVVDLDVTPDGRFLVAANSDRLLSFYRVPDLAQAVPSAAKLATVVLGGKISLVLVLTSGQYCLVGVAQELQLWDLAELARTGAPVLVRRYIGHRVGDDIVRACFGYLVPGGGGEELVLSGSADGYAYIWQLHTGQLVTRARAHDGMCNAVDWNRLAPPSPRDLGLLWCSVGDDHRVRVWGPDNYK